jgi:hypothetical protein
MDILVDHESFRERALRVRRGTFFRGPGILLDGKKVQPTKGVYRVDDDGGLEREIRLRGSAFDPVPRVEIDGECVGLGLPLAWYEAVWALCPLALLLLGGFLGGADQTLVRFAPWPPRFGVFWPQRWTALLLLSGGALGGVIGLCASYANTAVFRGNLTRKAKFAVTGGITVSATLVVVVAVLVFRQLLFPNLGPHGLVRP